MLRQYVYISTADGIGPAEIALILEACQRNNAARGITGLLLYNGRNFLQLLEGDVEDLSWVMRKIEADPRHGGVSIIEDISIATRACPDWLMRHIRIADQVSERRATLDAELPAEIEPNLRRIILNFAALN
ncbi:BLUF domain-containing protein [Altererythrobacter sp. Z27]|uniref:BLUF domain-containing protein n=1 Tax=Altererythrobacter sp. Z27 TaxID=3461147 RepID=UPI004043F26C